MLTERRDRVSMCSQRNKLKRSPFLRYRSINISASTYIQRVRICNSRPTILCKFHQFYPFFNARNSQLAYRFGLNDSFSVTTTVHTWLTLTSTVFHVLKMSQFSIEISIGEPKGFFVPILKIHRFREIFFFFTQICSHVSLNGGDLAIRRQVIFLRILSCFLRISIAILERLIEIGM